MKHIYSEHEDKVFAAIDSKHGRPRGVAKLYAAALCLHGLSWHYQEANLMILQRWGVEGLCEIKDSAWRIAHRTTPS